MPTKRCLGCMASVPVQEAKRRGLFMEAQTKDLLDPSDERAPLMLSGHAPFGFPAGWPRTGRLNIAALDPEWRCVSMECLEEYLARAARMPALRTVITHAAPRFWPRQEGAPLEPAGEYAYLIEGLRRLADIARTLGLSICVENNRSYWDGVPDEQVFANAPRTVVQDYFATTPWEWRQVWRDVARENLWLCLDTSHATTCVHRIEDREDRRQALQAFLAEPHAIRHVHWNDNDPWDVKGRADRHLPVGSSGLGDVFHRAIVNLPDARFLLEHFTNLPTLDGELDYIAKL